MINPKIGDIYITPENKGKRIEKMAGNWLLARSPDGGVAKNYHKSLTKNWIKIFNSNES